MLRFAIRRLLLASIALGGCVWTSDGGFGARHVSDWEGELETEPGSYDGEPIVVIGNGGPITIRGVPGQDFIRLSASFVAGARSSEDAEAAFQDVFESLSIELEDGVWYVECNQAAQRHGSATPSGTGCASMELEVPAGDLEHPIDVRATTDFGGIHASALVVERLDLAAPFGLVADVVPVDGATIDVFGRDLVSGFCSSWLRVPEDTAFDALELSVGRPSDPDEVHASGEDRELWREAVIRGFEDAPAAAPPEPSIAWSRETPGPRISARVRASLGKAILTTDRVPGPEETTLCAQWVLGDGIDTPDD